MSDTPDKPTREPDHPAMLGVPTPPRLSIVRQIQVDLPEIEGWEFPLQAGRQIIVRLPAAVADMRFALGVSWATVASGSRVTSSRLRVIVEGKAEPSWDEVVGLYGWLRDEARKAAA